MLKRNNALIRYPISARDCKKVLFWSDLLDDKLTADLEESPIYNSNNRQVYLVQSSGNKQFSTYALKVIHFSKSKQLEEDKIRKEYRIISLLGQSHPHLLRSFGMQVCYNENDNTCEILLEYCGESLLNIYKHVSDSTMQNWIIQSLTALISLEELGISHIDIKPENITYKEPFIKIVDMGASVAFIGWQKSIRTPIIVFPYVFLIIKKLNVRRLFCHPIIIKMM